MNSAHFKNIRKEILDLLKEAKESVKIAMAWFTSSELFNSLIECLKRGVKVDLILLDDPINFMEYAPDFNEFIEMGGFLRIAFTNKGFMHHKFCIIDNSILVSGSYNWTYYAESRNIENIFITNDTSIVKEYIQEFEELEEKYSIASDSPRYSWNEIEMMDDIDFHEMNEEIHNISKAQNRVERKIIAVKPQVIISDLKMTPKASETIGILYVEGETWQLEEIIKKGIALPHSSGISVLFHHLGDGPLICDIATAHKSNGEKGRWIISKDCSEILPKESHGSVELKFELSLSDNGSLRVDISCDATNKKTTISILDSKLVYHD